MSSEGTCAVCGRTFLVGEQAHSYVSTEGRHEVCQLCVERAEAHGWLPAAQAGAEEALRPETGHRPGFFARLFTRPEAGEDEERFIGEEGDLEEVSADAEDEVRASQSPAPAPAPRGAVHELETQRYDVEAEWREAAREDVMAEGPADADAGSAPEGPADADPAVPHGAAADLPAPDEVPEPGQSPAPVAPAPPADASPAPLPDPAGRGMRPRRLQPDASPATRFERAVARFNASDAGRTAAGLTRTLGAPSVSVGNLAGEEDVVRVTVAWELTWYQWGVDLGAEPRPVFELERGFELAEIDAAARQWNASAHDGRITMIAPARRPAKNGRPVHR